MQEAYCSREKKREIGEKGVVQRALRFRLKKRARVGVRVEADSMDMEGRGTHASIKATRQSEQGENNFCFPLLLAVCFLFFWFSWYLHGASI